VTLAFQGGAGTANPSAVTGADGGYQDRLGCRRDYPKISATGRATTPASSTVTVGTQGATKDFAVRRDYAAASGGASVASFDGPDYSPACGPVGAIDNSQATGWGSTTGDDAGTPTNLFVPKSIVVDLKQAVDVAQFAVGPVRDLRRRRQRVDGRLRDRRLGPTAPPGPRQRPGPSRWPTAAGSTR
jgi:hypothetical protein